MKLSTTIAPDAPFSAPTMLRGDFCRCLSDTADLGFDGAELQFKAEAGNMPDASAIVRVCEKRNLEICALATGSLYTKNGLSLISSDQQVVDEALSRLKLYVDFASNVGGKVIIGCVRGNLDGQRTKEQYLRQLADGLAKLGEYGEKKKVGFLLEAINRYENNYLSTGNETAEFIRTYQLSGYTVLLDTFHMNMEERSIPAALRACAPLLGHVHTSDSTRLVPGTAHTDFRELIDVLRSIDYDRWLSFECCVDRDEYQEAKEGLSYMRNLLDNNMK